MNQPELYAQFHALHQRNDLFVMPNAWDGVSALLMKQAGFAALGSTSAAIAFALGREDGVHAVSREEALDNAALLSRLTMLPVNGDLEDGFGPAPEDCAATVEAAIAAGLAGLGIEDTTADPDKPIHDFDQAVARMRAAAKAAKGRIVLTGRADNYLNGRPDLDDTIRRLVAFAEAGADCLYAPGLPDMAAIEAVIRAVAPKPVNVLIGPGMKAVPLDDLRRLGVRRLSLGAVLYRHAMGALKHAVTALAAGDVAVATAALPGKDIMALLAAVP